MNNIHKMNRELAMYLFSLTCQARNDVPKGIVSRVTVWGPMNKPNQELRFYDKEFNNENIADELYARLALSQTADCDDEYEIFLCSLNIRIFKTYIIKKQFTTIGLPINISIIIDQLK